MPPSHLPPTDERALLREWADARQQSAVEALWTRYQRLAVAVAARILQGGPDPVEDARELADDAFLKALRTFRLDRVPAGVERPFRNWYLSLVRNAAIDRRRRAARVSLPGDLPERGHDPSDGLADGADLRRWLPLIRSCVATHFLPEDVRVFDAWLRCRRDGERVPWGQLSADHQVPAPAPVRFSLGRDEPVEPADLTAAVRRLRLCPALRVGVQPVSAPVEPDELAARRADVVCRALESDVRPRVVRDRSSGERLARWSSQAGVSGDPPRVQFTVIAGGRRSADALRMRVEKVVLGRVRAFVDETRKTP